MSTITLHPTCWRIYSITLYSLCAIATLSRGRTDKLPWLVQQIRRNLIAILS